MVIMMIIVERRVRLIFQPDLNSNEIAGKLEISACLESEKMIAVESVHELNIRGLIN